jgi:NAD(P)H-dependent FMN reductase
MPPVPRQQLHVITTSTRPGRVGRLVADWFLGEARAEGSFDVEDVDLATVNLPLFDEPHHPRLGQYTHEHTRAWSRLVSAADAFVFVIPEYNYGFNAAAKNAIDYLHAEWADKPVGFVSYGGVAAGTRAVQMLKQVLTTLRMVPVFESVNIPFVAQLLDEEGFHANAVLDAAALGMLRELARLDRVLAQLRTG